MPTIMITLVLLSMCSLVAWGGENHDDPPILTVSGVGKVHQAPDMAIVTLSVETAGETFSEVQQDNARRMQHVMKRLMELGIQAERMQTTDFSINPQYAPRPPKSSLPHSPSPPKIIGYRGRNQISVKVHDLDRVGAVVDSALEAGANRFSGINWVLREKDPVYLVALKTASKKAQQKAEVLAKSLGVNLVRLARVQEGGVHPFPKSRMLRGAAMSMAESAESVPVAPGQMTIQATVTLEYEIRSLP